jgi:D-methionine transport system ATP-binding protein
VTEPALSIEGVGFVADQGETILDGIDWTLERGQAASIIGPSGSGKSTLVRLINGLDSPTSGTLGVLGREVRDWQPRELRTRAVWVPQSPVATSGSARAYLEVALRLGIIDSEQLEQRREAALEVAALDSKLLDRDVARLSGGERQRLALARALLLDPEILILDEPTSSLDGETGRRVLDALDDWRQRDDRTLVVVTHRLGDVRRIGGHLLMLEAGRVRLAGPTAELLDGTEGDQIRRILAGEELS